ncbi:hypothetical protein AVEN_164762-1 [Araneus ventricosus]|uniref:Uncharacterized protein n=1 Tax=Araneus ventricosus TaxID=182803 RepID=A0A4Y2DPB6_ARAVE|nr:hypothetical protein AVEN_164762-1 [Araneus ventricosus]
MDVLVQQWQQLGSTHLRQFVNVTIGIISSSKAIQPRFGFPFKGAGKRPFLVRSGPIGFNSPDLENRDLNPNRTPNSIQSQSPRLPSLFQTPT